MKTLPAFGLLCLVPVLRAAVPLPGSGTVIESFNALPSTTGTAWTDNVTLLNWYLHRSNPSAPTPIPLLINDNVAATAWSAGLYSLGGSAGTDRALGGAPTGTFGEISHVVILQNTSALPVQLTGIAYTVEKWRENSTAGITERIDFSYQKSISEASLAASLATGWTEVDNLDVVVPHSGAAGAMQNPGLTFSTNQPPALAVVLEPGEFIALRWLNSNEIGSDAYLGIDDVAVSYATVNGAITATPQDIVRDTKQTTALEDDTFSFKLPVAGLGAVSLDGWLLTAPLPAAWTGPSSGSYGDIATYSGIPVSTASVSLTLRDSANAGISRTVIIATPPVPANLTPSSGPMEVRFASPLLGSTSFARKFNEGLTDLGWTSNAPVNAFNGVRTRPGDGDPNQFFRIRNAKLNRFETEPVNIEAVAGFDVSLQLAAYTTTASGFEDGPASAPTFAASDRLQVVVEASADGLNWTVASPSLVSSTQTGVSQFTDFRIADPGTGYTADNIVPGSLPAVIPFPATRSLRFTRGTAALVRLVIVGGNDSDSENTLFDNIRFAAIPPVIAAALSNVVRNNLGDDDATNDTFSFSIAVTNADPGRTLGWTCDVPGISGLYSANPVAFPTYPVSGGARQITFTDVADPSFTLAYAVPLPAGVLMPGVPLAVRNEGATSSPADDTWSFSVVVTTVNGGTGFFNSLTAASANYGTSVSLGPFPVSAGAQPVTFTDRSNPAWTTTANFSPPIRPILATVSTGGPPGVVYSTVSPAITGWAEGAGQGVLVQTNGGGTVPHVMRSEAVDLSDVNGAVRFRADFTATEDSAGTNFEANDTFRIQLELTSPAGTTTVNLLTAAQDTGNGAASGTANGPPNGVLNGFTGVAATGVTAVQDYDANRERDEFNLPVNGVRATAADSFASPFRFATLIPDEVTTARLVVTGLNNSPTETFTVSGMSFVVEGSGVDSDGDGVSNADEQTAGTNPNDPADALRLGGFAIVPASNPLTVQSSFSSKSGRFYRLYRSPDLQNWTSDGPTLTGDGSTMDVFAQPGSPAPPRLYFRLMVRQSDDFPATTP